MLSLALLINTGCVTVRASGVVDMTPKELTNTVTILNKTPFDTDYTIVQIGPNYAPFFIMKNMRYRGWIKAHGKITMKDVPVGHYWAVFKIGPKFANLQYVVDANEPIVINLTYNAKKIWVRYDTPRLDKPIPGKGGDDVCPTGPPLFH
jgi:hypothetical protein